MQILYVAYTVHAILYILVTVIYIVTYTYKVNYSLSGVGLLICNAV
jgi:hypothetical protein